MCVCILRYISVNTSTLILIAASPQKEKKKKNKLSFSPLFPWSIKKKKKKKKESGDIGWKQSICFLRRHLRRKRCAILVLQLAPDYRYFSMVQNTLIIVLATVGINNVLNLGPEFILFKKTPVQWFE